MHVVEVRHAQQRRKHDADDAALFVRMNRVVPRRQRPADRGEREQRVEHDLRARRTDPHAAKKRRLEAPKQSQPGHRHGLPERIRHEIHLVTELGERADTVELAERGAARLEERLGRDHQNAQGSGDFRTKP